MTRLLDSTLGQLTTAFRTASRLDTRTAFEVSTIQMVYVALVELQERRQEGTMKTQTYYCPSTDRAFELDVDGVEWDGDSARIDCPAHEQPGRHSITIGRPVTAGFGGGDE